MFRIPRPVGLYLVKSTLRRSRGVWQNVPRAVKRPQPKTKTLNIAQRNKPVQMQADKMQQLEDENRELKANLLHSLTL